MDNSASTGGTKQVENLFSVLDTLEGEVRELQERVYMPSPTEPKVEEAAPQPFSKLRVGINRIQEITIKVREVKNQLPL